MIDCANNSFNIRVGNLRKVPTERDYRTKFCFFTIDLYGARQTGDSDSYWGWYKDNEMKSNLCGGHIVCDEIDNEKISSEDYEEQNSKKQ